jgi:hypothetical protein
MFLVLALLILLLSAVSVRSSSPTLLRVQARALLSLAMAPGNGGLPRPRLWAASQDRQRQAETIEATERERRRLRAATFAMSIAEPTRVYAPILAPRRWPGSTPWETGGPVAPIERSTPTGPYRRVERPGRDMTWYSSDSASMRPRRVARARTPIPR